MGGRASQYTCNMLHIPVLPCTGVSWACIRTGRTAYETTKALPARCTVADWSSIVRPCIIQDIRELPERPTTYSRAPEPAHNAIGWQGSTRMSHVCLCARFVWTLSSALRASMLQGAHLDLQACHKLGRRDKRAPPVRPGRRCVGHLPLSRCLSGRLITTLTG